MKITDVVSKILEHEKDIEKCKVATTAAKQALKEPEPFLVNDEFVVELQMCRSKRCVNQDENAYPHIRIKQQARGSLALLPSVLIVDVMRDKELRELGETLLKIGTELEQSHEDLSHPEKSLEEMKEASDQFTKDMGW